MKLCKISLKNKSYTHIRNKMRLVIYIELPASFYFVIIQYLNVLYLQVYNQRYDK